MRRGGGDAEEEQRDDEHAGSRRHQELFGGPPHGKEGQPLGNAVHHIENGDEKDGRPTAQGAVLDLGDEPREENESDEEGDEDCTNQRPYLYHHIPKHL